nr:MAG TPA: tail tube protein [Caudoviricetes sp.]
MKNYYLSIGGKKVRVEMNWNAMMTFCEEKGIDDLSKLSEDGNVTPRDLLTIMYSAIKEGERMDGHTFELTKEGLSEIVRPSDITSFLKIYKEQCGGGDDVTGKVGVAKKKNVFQRLILKG